MRSFENTDGWTLPAPVYPPLDQGCQNENVESSGQSIVENTVPAGVVVTQANPFSAHPAKSVVFVLPGESVSQLGSRREVVYGIWDGIIAGNLQLGRAQTNVANAPLYTGAIPWNQPTQFSAFGVHPRSSEMLHGRDNNYLPSVTTMTCVNLTTTTTTQSCGTVPSLRNSLSPVMTTSSHGASPGDHPPRPSFPVHLVGSPSPMVTTCSVTSRSSTPVYVSSPSVDHVPLPASNVPDVLTPQLEVATILGAGNSKQCVFRHEATRECGASADDQGEQQTLTPCGAGDINAHTSAVAPSQAGNFGAPNDGFFPVFT